MRVAFILWAAQLDQVRARSAYLHYITKGPHDIWIHDMYAIFYKFGILGVYSRCFLFENIWRSKQRNLPGDGPVRMAGTREEGEGEKRFHSQAIYVYPVTEIEFTHSVRLRTSIFLIVLKCSFRFV